VARISVSPGFTAYAEALSGGRWLPTTPERSSSVSDAGLPNGATRWSTPATLPTPHHAIVGSPAWNDATLITTPRVWWSLSWQR